LLVVSVVDVEKWFDTLSIKKNHMSKGREHRIRKVEKAVEIKSEPDTAVRTLCIRIPDFLLPVLRREATGRAQFVRPVAISLPFQNFPAY